ncbi:MAG: F0F1 ATP synthase subunit B [Gammaproteobacteria bacterium]|nr:F0F1 ATP synthase subunit B [Gammaproteobacteria bacterium]
MNINITIIWSSIAFLIFTWSCYYFIWPPIMAAIRTRQKTIADGIENAETAARDVEQAEQQASEIMRNARLEAQTLLDQARSQATALVEAAKTEGREEGERLKAAGVAEIEQESNRIRESLRGDVATLAVQGAERILESDIDSDKHRAMLEKLAAEL